VTLPVVWTRAADSELKGAKGWYEAVRPGLGDGSRSPSRQQLQASRRIRCNSRQCKSTGSGAAAVVRRFPTGVFGPSTSHTQL